MHQRLAKLCTLTIIAYATSLQADEIRFYFNNDSVNGLKISDAYETHDMGIEYENNFTRLNFNLAIVSPDMHVYENEYRQANRAFGEIVSITYGRKLETADGTRNIEIFGRSRASGKFGFDETQDFAHRILNLREVTRINELVRMPNNTWIGFGLGYKHELPTNRLEAIQSASAEIYLGTDASYLRAGYNYEHDLSYATLTLAANVTYVKNDEIVSAQPVGAQVRDVIPAIEIGLRRVYSDFTLYAVDRFSLPTISSDDSIFGTLKAGISFDF